MAVPRRWTRCIIARPRDSRNVRWAQFTTTTESGHWSTISQRASPWRLAFDMSTSPARWTMRAGALGALCAAYLAASSAKSDMATVPECDPIPPRRRGSGLNENARMSPVRPGYHNFPRDGRTSELVDDVHGRLFGAQPLAARFEPAPDHVLLVVDVVDVLVARHHELDGLVVGDRGGVADVRELPRQADVERLRRHLLLRRDAVVEAGGGIRRRRGPRLGVAGHHLLGERALEVGDPLLVERTVHAHRSSFSSPRACPSPRPAKPGAACRGQAGGSTSRSNHKQVP